MRPFGSTERAHLCFLLKSLIPHGTLDLVKSIPVAIKGRRHAIPLLPIFGKASKVLSDEASAIFDKIHLLQKLRIKAYSATKA